MFRKPERNADDFWQEYEEKIGEKVLARSLGKYISGWEEFDSKGWNMVWGLNIVTSGGFRFHHFPQMSWIEALTRFGGQNEPKEKTFFVPKERIISARIISESRWWRKILSSVSPQLLIKYRDDSENERQLLMEVDYYAGNKKFGDLVEALSGAEEKTEEPAN